MNSLEIAELAFKEWEKTETFRVSEVEAYGFINGYNLCHRQLQAEIEAQKVKNQALKVMNDGKNKIIEEYERKYPNFFFMEHDLQGER